MEGAQARTVTINPSGKFRASLFSFLLSFSSLVVEEEEEEEEERKRREKKEEEEEEEEVLTFVFW